MKTIQQLAYELNVSKTAIRKHIRELGMESFLLKDGNKFLIDEAQEYMIRMSFEELKTQTKTKTGSQTETKTNSELVRILEKQLDEKQKTIDALLEKLDQEQKLHAMTQQKLLALEDQTEQKKGVFAWFRKG